MGCEESKVVDTRERHQHQPREHQPRHHNMKSSSSSTSRPAYMDKRYKLTYFAVRGRAEPFRMMFAARGVKFEEANVSFEDWPAMKSSTPWGSLPILEVGGKRIVQSIAIARYIAAEMGFVGDNHEDQARGDMITLCIEEFKDTFFGLRFQIRTGSLPEGRERDEKIQKPIEFYDKLVPFIEREMAGDFLLGNKPTLADFWLYHAIEIAVDSVMPDAWEKSNVIRAWRTRFENLSPIRKFLDARPKDYNL